MATERKLKKLNALLLNITYEQLLDMLDIPTDANVTILSQSPEQILERRFTLLIEHPTLPHQLEGASLRAVEFEVA